MPISPSARWSSARICPGAIRLCPVSSGACWSATARRWRAPLRSCVMPRTAASRRTATAAVRRFSCSRARWPTSTAAIPRAAGCATRPAASIARSATRAACSTSSPATSARPTPPPLRGDGFLLEQAGRQAVDAARIVLAPICLEPVLALRLGPPGERRALAAVVVERHAKAAGGLHELDIEYHDLPRADRLLAVEG